jgi:hypothetical protein
MTPKKQTEWIHNGCSVEVKWENDWWHAKVKKVSLSLSLARALSLFVCVRARDMVRHIVGGPEGALYCRIYI